MLEVIRDTDVGIVLPDGTRLSAQVWRPAGGGRYPAILEYIPYRWRDGTAARDAAMHPWFAAQGYVAIRVDIRGHGQSRGVPGDEYSPQELQDACDVIAWIADQPWCDGAVGMMGKSWGGFNCLQVAAMRPPVLRAVVSVCATTDRFADDIHFKGGCLMGRNFGWGAVMQSYAARPPDPSLTPDWQAEWLARLQADRHLAPLWASHQGRGDYWRHGSVCEDWSAIQVPVQVWGGWMDGYINTVSELIENLSVPVTGIAGPWVHQYAHQAVPGPAIGFLQQATRWWDRWLKGIANGAEDDPAMRLFLRDAAAPDPCMADMPGEWVESGWPVAQGRSLHLAGTALADQPGPLAATIASPLHLGLTAGEYFPMGLDGEMPGDQRADDALSVCFDGAVLEAPLVLAGRAVVRLRLSSDQPLGFVVARLNAVLPDGSSMRIAHGMLNLCHRADRTDPQRMVPGQAEDIAITLDLAAMRLEPGARLRLALSNAYWPFLWPSPQAGALSVTGGSLTLPEVDTAALAPWQPPTSQAAAPAGITVTGARAARRIEHDLTTGTRTLVVEDESGWRDHADTGWRTRALTVERWSIRDGDPLSAMAEIRWHQQFARDGWDAETEATSRLTATAEALVFHGATVARANGIVIHHDAETREVPRRFV
jgi:hypothetical protein